MHRIPFPGQDGGGGFSTCHRTNDGQVQPIRFRQQLRISQRRAEGLLERGDAIRGTILEGTKERPVMPSGSRTLLNLFFSEALAKPHDGHPNSLGSVRRRAGWAMRWIPLSRNSALADAVGSKQPPAANSRAICDLRSLFALCSARVLYYGRLCDSLADQASSRHSTSA
jgi:hypothetical protein